ncbi:hypothetical protein D3C86_1461280 [compost metagenome]
MSQQPAPFVIPADVLAKLIKEPGKEGGYYQVAHQAPDVMTVIVADNQLVQIPVTAPSQNAIQTTPHPVGTKVYFSPEGKLLDAIIPSFAAPKASKAQGCDTPRKQA